MVVVGGVLTILVAGGVSGGGVAEGGGGRIRAGGSTAFSSDFSTGLFTGRAAMARGSWGESV